jgi:hypothetical protein
MCALSAAIETTQFLFIPGRDATIADLITNSLGGALGFTIARYASLWLRPSRRAAAVLAIAAAAFWLAVQAVSSFAFSLAIPDTRFYGQLARRLGHFEQFQGRVIRGAIADVSIPDTRFEDSERVRRLLSNGAAVTATIQPAGLTAGIAPIVRIADQGQREIVLVAQDVGHLFFGVRTGAGLLRLRPPFFALPDVFLAAPRTSGGYENDTIAFNGQYNSREAQLRAQGSAGTHDRRISIVSSLGWTLVLPFQWWIEGTAIERVLSMMWVALFLLPVGYWGARWQAFAAGNRGRERMMQALLLLAVLFAGLVLVPRAYGLSPAPLLDWLAALTGISLGALLQSRFAAS